MRNIIRKPFDSSSLFPNNLRTRLPITQRPPHETADALLAVCTEWIPPGEYGKAQLVFPDTTKADPLNNRWLQALAGADNEIDVFDLNAQNCILEKELFYVVYDADWGCFVPVGSCGLIRRAKANEDYLYYNPGAGVFDAVIEGAESTSHIVEVSAEWTSEPVYENEKMWIVYLPFDDPAQGGRPQRTGQWHRIQRIPGDTKIFQAPTGGIPAAVTTFMGGVTCPVWERQPNTDSLRVASSGESIKVWNWTPNVIAKDGLRLGIAAYMLGGWFAIADYCQTAGENSGSSTPGSTASKSLTNPVQIEDYASGAGVGSTFSFSTLATLDPEIIPYATPVADLSGTIAAITLSAGSTGYEPV
jgi:hypothetical protein